jgi:hypothetical protein
MKSTFNVELDSELRLDLECIRHAAFLGTPAAKVVRAAVRAFIDRRLQDDPTLKAAFTALREQKLREASANAGDKVSFLQRRKRK